MNLNKETAEIYIPDDQPIETALKRTTHLGVGAHQDDLEIMAVGGILKCFQKDDAWFSGVVVTDGRGSPRNDIYGSYSDEEMRVVRFKEQKKAAMLGEYGAQIFLDYSSSAVKSSDDTSVIDDLVQVLMASTPEVVYTHNLADKHDTHVAVALRVISAIQKLPAKNKPQKLFGCEVWRDLDWLVDSDKIALDVSLHENLQLALLGVFDSQIVGGKRYDQATMGRRRANATYYASHETDTSSGIVYAMDLTPLISDLDVTATGFIEGYIRRFSIDILQRLKKFG